MSSVKKNKDRQNKNRDDLKNRSQTESPRADLKHTLARDFQRHGRREDSHHSFWRWLGVLGMVGWPIAIMTVGGALLGHSIDLRFNSGIQFTLLLLTIGAIVSSVVAWKALGANR